MPVFRKVMDRLADLLRHDRKVTYRAFINASVAPHVTPLLDRIIADDEDRETRRFTLIPWQRAERPPIALYRGNLSTCRIDGPWQVAAGHWLPLGSLIDRKTADSAAKAMIAAWASGREADAVPDISPGEAEDCCSDEAASAMCEACRKGPDHD